MLPLGVLSVGKSGTIWLVALQNSSDTVTCLLIQLSGLVSILQQFQLRPDGTIWAQLGERSDDRSTVSNNIHQSTSDSYSPFLGNDMAIYTTEACRFFHHVSPPHY